MAKVQTRKGGAGAKADSGAEKAAPLMELWKSAEDFVTVGEVVRAAEQALPAPAWNFLDGGAGDEWTAWQNRKAFERWEFLPTFLSGSAPPDTKTTFLGVPVPVPLLTAPFGMDKLFHPDGVLAVARAHARIGSPFIVSLATSYSLEEVAEAAPDCPRMLQVVPNVSEDRFLGLARRAKQAGYLGLCVTVDGPVPGWRDRSIEDRFTPDPSHVSANFRTPTGEIDVAALAEIGSFTQPVWTWERLGEVCARTDLPFVVKGVLTAADARAAVDVGAKGIYVSNHGGRQLDGAPAALGQLPEIVAEVAGRVEVIFDGGVRRGSDILKALALGATMVGVGRASAMGLAAAGEDGVHRVLELLAKELAVTMALVGRDSIAGIDASVVRPVSR